MTALDGGSLIRGGDTDSARRVVLMTNDAATKNSVASLLKASGSDPGRLEICSSLPQLVVQLEKTSASVALVDVDPEPVRTMRELEPLISRFNQTRFIVLTGGSANELIFEAMQIGARHLLSKKSIETELMGVLGRFIASDSATPTGRG